MTEKIGKYEVREKIGVGGFGEVYKGYDPFIKRLVAVKTCSSSDQDIRSRFFHEAEIAGRLNHRNITTVYDFGIHDEVPYLIQEYLSGEDLDRKVKRRDYLPFAEKLYYLLQVARGLGHAHSKGVIHRDIKPANIRILEDGTAKIMDFGIAKLAQQETGLTQTGMTLGTAAYLAPEQIRGDDVDLSTDVFSFGIMAYELLVFERPFRGKQISVVLHQILDKEPPSLVEKWPAAPPEIVAFIDRCLQKDPTQRLQDGSELLKELERIQKHGRGAAPEHGEVDDRPTVQLAGQGVAAQRPPAPPTPPPTAPPPTRAIGPAADDELQPTAPAVAPPAGVPAAGVPAAGVPAAGEKRRDPPTIDDIEFSLSGSVEPAAAAAPPTPRSRRGAGTAKRVFLPVLLLLAVAAVAGGWWLGTREGGLEELIRWATDGTGEETGGPASREPDPPDTAVEVTSPPGVGPSEGRPPGGRPPGGSEGPDATTATSGDSLPEGGATGEGPSEAGPGTGDSGTAVADTATEPPPVADPEVPKPAEETPPPPPAAPAKGKLAIARVEWTDVMTVTLAGTTYPLHRGREISLPPGSYNAVFETRMADYPMRRTVTVTVEAGKKAHLRSPIPRPGALSARPLPRRPQGEVWVDGKPLSSPVRKIKKTPGEYSIEIRPVGGGQAISERFTIEPGQETLLTFDLDRGELKKRFKSLD